MNGRYQTRQNIIQGYPTLLNLHDGVSQHKMSMLLISLFCFPGMCWILSRGSVWFSQVFGRYIPLEFINTFFHTIKPYYNMGRGIYSVTAPNCFPYTQFWPLISFHNLRWLRGICFFERILSYLRLIWSDSITLDTWILDSKVR